MLRSRINSLAYRFLRRVVPKKFTLYEAAAWSPETLLGSTYLSGEGIEIGALHHPFPVPPGVRVRYVDRAPLHELQRTFPQLPITTPPDVVDDAETLATFADASVDFIIASHILEHTQDLIGTLKNMFRVLKPNGILFIRLPDKRFTFDVDRPATPWEHLLRDHAEGPEWSTRAAFEEVVRVILEVTDPDEVEHYVDTEIREVGHTHFHVWGQREMLELLARLKDVLDLEVETYVSSPDRGDAIIVLRKGERKNPEMVRGSLDLIRQSFADRYPTYRTAYERMKRTTPARAATRELAGRDA